MAMTLKDRLVIYLRKVWLVDNDFWTHKGKLEDLAKAKGYLGETAGRQLRELVEENKIDHRPNGKSQEFRYLPDLDDIVKTI